MTQLQAEIDGYAAQGNGEMVAKLEKELKYLIDNPGTDNDVRKGEYYDAADNLRASGERDIAAAKEGQGRFGRALIDAEVAAPLVRAIYDNSSLKDYGSLDFYKNELYEGRGRWYSRIDRKAR